MATDIAQTSQNFCTTIATVLYVTESQLSCCVSKLIVKLIWVWLWNEGSEKGFGDEVVKPRPPWNGKTESLRFVKAVGLMLLDPLVKLLVCSWISFNHILLFRHSFKWWFGLGDWNIFLLSSIVKVVGTATPKQPVDPWNTAWKFSTGEELMMAWQSPNTAPTFCLKIQTSSDYSSVSVDQLSYNVEFIVYHH